MCSCEDCPATCGVKDGHEHKPGYCILVGSCEEHQFLKVDDKDAFSQVCLNRYYADQAVPKMMFYSVIS